MDFKTLQTLLEAVLIIIIAVPLIVCIYSVILFFKTQLKYTKSNPQTIEELLVLANSDKHIKKYFWIGTINNQQTEIIWVNEPRFAKFYIPWKKHFLYDMKKICDNYTAKDMSFEYNQDDYEIKRCSKITDDKGLTIHRYFYR